MAIKMIVTDLDGTFYHQDLTYDKKRFNRLYKQMEENDINFVVASGNQYYQLISFFDNPERMTFVSENGGYIVDKGKELFSVEIKKDIYHSIVDVINHYPEISVKIICGKKSAYAPSEMDEKTFQFFENYFPVMEKINDLHDVDDQIIKFSLMCDEDIADEIAIALSQVMDESLTAVTSGHGCIDLIVTGVHKGNALKTLMNMWNIKEDEIMAFGDARNDLEMLQIARYGFVMANGTDELKEKIGKVVPFSNEEDGELEVIEEYFLDPNGFLEKYK